MSKFLSSLCASALLFGSVAFARANNRPVTSAVQFPSASAELFKKKISSDVLHTNYTLSFHSYLFTDSDELPEVLSSLNRLRTFVADRVYAFCLANSHVPGHCKNGSDTLRDADVSQYSDEAASQGLAQWIYDLDGDNWLNFDQVVWHSQRYLDTGRRQLRVFHGFDPDGVLSQGLLQKDLPMVVDFDEKTMTFWTLRLED